MSVSGISSSAGRLSWSVSGKDRNGDGIVTKAEFMAPVTDPNQTTIVPADLRAGGSLEDVFGRMDKHGDGQITADEMLGTGSRIGKDPDRFTPGWDLGMTDAQRDAYIAKVDADNDVLTAQWAAARSNS